MKTLHHYVIVREDLPTGVQFAQTIHAAGESCEGPLPSGTYAYALGARDEQHLLDIAQRLWDAEIPHTVINEPDEPYLGDAMAIGIWPTADKDRIRRVTSDLPLLGKRRA
ncbi:MAG TPA: hypothetical protein VFT74_18870 [Isosphaeraceae bacterium]|nr:hypothetical protein [Isosphaeraceae bacterium]